MQIILLLFAGVLVLNCLPFIPKDEKQVPTGAFFAGAIAVFDKTWKGPAISYIGRDELEACGEAFLAQVRQQAEKLVREMAA